jgi:hypothetical protein
MTFACCHSSFPFHTGRTRLLEATDLKAEKKVTSTLSSLNHQKQLDHSKYDKLHEPIFDCYDLNPGLVQAVTSLHLDGDIENIEDLARLRFYWRYYCPLDD